MNPKSSRMRNCQPCRYHFSRWPDTRCRGAIPLAHKPQHRQPQQDQPGSEQRSSPVAGVARDQHHGGREHEDGGEHRVSPHAIGARELRMAAAIDEDGGGGEHVEEPLGEDRQFEVLLELGEEQQQHGREQPLHHERSGRRLEARMDVRELRKEEAVASCGEGNARAGHDGAVERDEDAERHGGGDESRAARAGHDRKCGDRGAFAGRDLRGGQNVLNGRVGGHEERADDEEAADESDGQAALRTANFAGHHGEIVPSVVGPEGGDQSGHEAVEAARGMRARWWRSCPTIRWPKQSRARRR